MGWLGDTMQMEDDMHSDASPKSLNEQSHNQHNSEEAWDRVSWLLDRPDHNHGTAHGDRTASVGRAHLEADVPDDEWDDMSRLFRHPYEDLEKPHLYVHESSGQDDTDANEEDDGNDMARLFSSDKTSISTPSKTADHSWMAASLVNSKSDSSFSFTETYKPMSIKEYFKPGNPDPDIALIQGPWKIVSHAPAVSMSDIIRSFSNELDRTLPHLKQKIRDFVAKTSSLEHPFAPGSDWWPRLHDTENGSADLLAGFMTTFTTDIKRVMKLAKLLPSYNSQPPTFPTDRRPVKSSRLTIATYNCQWLGWYQIEKYKNPEHLIHNFYHSVYADG